MALISAGSAIPSHELPKLGELWLVWAHRMTHLVEYSGLGALLMRAYNRWKSPSSSDLRPVLVLTVGVLFFALLDEWHQSFVPGRSPQLLDSTFDTICAAIGMLIYRMRMRA